MSDDGISTGDTPSTSSEVGGAASPAAPEPTAASTSASASDDKTFDTDQEGLTPRAPAPKGPIPYDRHEAILRKAREDAEKQYGWAKRYSPQDVEQIQSFRQAYAADPIGTLQREFQALAEHPQYGPQLRSLIGRQLANRPAAAPPPLEPIPVQLSDGRVISVLPADQLDRFEQQVLAKAQQALAPTRETLERLERAERLAEAQQQAQSFATGFYQKLAALPHFKELEADVKARLGEARLQSDHPSEVARAAYEIYQTLFAEKVLPNLANRQAVLSDINRQAQASTVNPRSISTQAKKSIQNADSTADALRIAIEQAVGR